MDKLHPATIALVLIVIPVLWSAMIALIRQAALRGQPALCDTSEKMVLATMMLPVVAGIAVLIAPSMPAPLSQLPLMPDGVDDVVSVATQTFVHTTAAGPDLLAWGMQALLAVCVLGAMVALGRLAWTHIRLSRIVKTAVAAHDGVFYTDADVPAFAWNRRSIVMPQGLRALAPAQITLILSHERAHQKRNDPLWFLSLSVVEALFWFNPLIARQGRACRLAAELACDAAVVAGQDNTRMTYARTLVAALKLTTGQPLTCVPAVGEKDSYRMRLGRIMKPARAPNATVWLAAAALLIAPVTLAQFAFAKGHAVSLPVPPAAVLPVSAAPATTSKPAFAIPVDGQIGDGFGARPKPPVVGGPKFHQGIDFIAPLGTPVKASADGKVTFVGNQPGYGTVIEIEHASDMYTRYAHLSRTDVTRGDAVTAGQLIGAVGNTGKSAQPHLHFEIWRGEIWGGGRPLNPAPLLGLTQN